MRALNIITLILAIVGAINWGLVGAFDFNLVSTLFGVDTIVTNAIYILVGLSGLYQLVPLAQSLSTSHRVTDSGHTSYSAAR